MPTGKVTGWVMCYELYEVKVLVLVKADSQIQAGDKFVRAGFDVVDEKQIRQSVCIEPPGPETVQNIPEIE